MINFRLLNVAILCMVLFSSFTECRDKEKSSKNPDQTIGFTVHGRVDLSTANHRNWQIKEIVTVGALCVADSL